MSARISASMTVAVVLAASLPGVSAAQTTYSEDFTGGSTTNNWYFFNGGCLTASTNAAGSNPGQIPGCTAIASTAYSGDAALVGGQNGIAGNKQTLPDPTPTGGALRFTNGAPFGYSEHGAIVSQNAFDAGQGVQITFKTVTYRGNSGGAGHDGADGMSFYLLDGSIDPSNPLWNGIGSWGGSLGYTCSNANPPYDGLVGAYLGLGIDEYGNFLNGTNWVAGYTGPNNATGDNSALGYGYKPGRIGLRGAGNVSWAYLNTTYPSYYPTSTLNTTARQQAAVQKTCSTGQVWNYSASATNPTAVANPSPALLDYAPITGAYSELPATVSLANEAAMARPDGLAVGNVLLYNLKITQNGLLSFSYSVNGGAYTNVITAQSISASNGALPATLRFGFAGSTGGSTNIHEILCFKAAPATLSASSAAVNQKQTSEVQTTSQAYFAFYNPNDWTGRVTAYGLIDTGGILSLQTAANWDSECVLSGVPSGQNCLYTGDTGPISAQASRVMWTWNGLDTAGAPGTAGIPFEWANLTSTEQTALGAQTRLNYLRGDRSLEINSSGAGTYRARDGILADIIDASPTFVGPPSSPYLLQWKDRLVPSDAVPEGTSYQTFQSNNQGRLNVIYAGANDGFLHGFRTGSQDVAGNVIDNATTPNDGAEVMAYMPGAALNTIHNATSNLDYSNTQYAHAFFVDATPGVGDLYYSGAWHTWLVGGLGPGGAAIYALDVTNPAGFTEAASSSLVKGEWSSATITCVGNANCGNSLGNTYGTPEIRRFHNGSWGAIFGNGYGSTNGDAGIFVMLVSQSGAISFYYLSAGAAGSNGIAYTSSADLDGDHIVDYVYAGDLKGNVWRFDLTSNNAGSWGLSSTGQPIFKTPAGQPITTPVLVASANVGGTTPQVMLGFGTGQRTQFTTTSSTTYSTGTQALYGIWDWNLSAWNALSNADYTSMTTAQAATAGLSAPYTLSTSNLQQQTFTINAGTPSTITASDTPFTWKQCASSCNTGKFGWYANLPGTNGATLGGASLLEQIVSTPTLFQGAILVNSTIPANNRPLDCKTPTTDTGVTYALSIVTGGAFAPGGGTATSSTTTFSSAFVNYHDTPTIGIGTNETGALSILNTAERTTFLLGQDIQVTAGSAPGGLQQIGLSNTTVNRLTWVELR